MSSGSRAQRPRKPGSALDTPGVLLDYAVRRMPEEYREWGAAMQAELEHVQPWLRRWSFALGCIRVALFPPRATGWFETFMNLTKSIIPTNPRAAALIGLVLALPIPLILSIAAFQIEPLHTFLKAWATAEDGVRQTTASFITLIVAFLLLPVASLITLAPVVRSVRAGSRLSASGMNVSLGVVILSVFVAILGVVFVDQLPCFLGRPNCD